MECYTCKSYYNKISVLQNKAVKIVGGGKWNDKATPFYVNLNILELSDLVQLHKAFFVFNFKSNKLPSTFKNYFKAACNIHQKIPEVPVLITFSYLIIELTNCKNQLKFKIRRYRTPQRLPQNSVNHQKLKKKQTNVFFGKIILKLRTCKLINSPIYFTFISLPVAR